MFVLLIILALLLFLNILRLFLIVLLILFILLFFFMFHFLLTGLLFLTHVFLNNNSLWYLNLSLRFWSPSFWFSFFGNRNLCRSFLIFLEGNLTILAGAWVLVLFLFFKHFVLSLCVFVSIKNSLFLFLNFLLSSNSNLSLCLSKWLLSFILNCLIALDQVLLK